MREKKLATLLATEVFESEGKWLNFDYEESQVKVDLGDMILEHLVAETLDTCSLLELYRHDLTES